MQKLMKELRGNSNPNLNYYLGREYDHPEIFEIGAQQDFFRAQAEFKIALGLSAKEEIVLEQNKKPPQ